VAHIDDVKTYYALNGAQSQKVAVQLIAFLLGLA